jgi:hypothetical protein
MTNAKDLCTSKVIVFSKDRAMQLDATLRSFYAQCRDANSLSIHVLYLATDRHIRQYQELIQAYPKVDFLPQKDFRKDLLSLLNPYAPGSAAERIYLLLSRLGNLGFPLDSLPDRIWRRTFEYIQRLSVKSFMPAWHEERYVLFLVDDNIFTQSFVLGEVVDLLQQQKNLLGFSLRLGENTNHCYANNRPQRLPVFHLLNSMVSKFDWTVSDQDFGYPLEVSSSLYRLKDILPFMVGLPFKNPNELEDRMAFRTKVFRYTHPFLGCYRHSVTFCNPINKVQQIISNRSGENTDHGVEALALRFERGERIRVQAYSGFVPSACHQEVELVFEGQMANE